MTPYKHFLIFLLIALLLMAWTVAAVIKVVLMIGAFLVFVVWGLGMFWR